MLDHQLRQAGAVDEDDALRHAFGLVVRLVAEVARCEEDALLGLLSRQCVDETLNLFAAHAVFLALGLDIGDIKAQAILSVG